MNSNGITVVVITLILVGGGYWYFTSQSGNQPPLTSSTAGADNPAQSQFQALVSELSPISFNTDIFSDPRFTALVDLKTPIAPEAAGRIDPFAPIGGASGL
jgi:hypothetical protein